MRPRTVPAARREALGLREAPALDTWQEPVANRWSFRHFDETVPTATVSRVPMPERRPARGLGALAAVPDLARRLGATCTDALVVLRGEEIVGEHYAPGFGPERAHLLMSISKSLCGIVVGTLVDEGRVDPVQRASRYVPELAGSAFGNATLRQILDMTVAVAYSEDYTDPASEVQAHDRASGWRSALPDDPADVYGFLTGLRPAGSHGRRFQYCSAATDVLAWIVENVTGQRYAEVLADRLWSRLGSERDARISVDRGGFAFANGGVACTARDLARVGRLMLDGGRAGGEQIVSSSWVVETMAGGEAALTAGSPKRAVFPGFSYRNQWWAVGDERGSVHAAGIHGQYVWLDPAADVVIVKFSSEPEPTDLGSTRAHAGLFADLVEAAS